MKSNASIFSVMLCIYIKNFNIALTTEDAIIRANIFLKSITFKLLKLQALIALMANITIIGATAPAHAAIVPIKR
jgi:hypothetical protein